VHRWVLVLVAALPVAAGGCSSERTRIEPTTTTAVRIIGPVEVGPGATPVPAGGSASEPAAPAAPDPGILGFQAPLVGGGTLDAGTLVGQPVAFWFWAPT
jgi:hypothetical protein